MKEHKHEWFDAFGWLGFSDQYCIHCPEWRYRVDDPGIGDQMFAEQMVWA